MTALRESLGLTNAEMAREVGVSKGRISQLETSGGTLGNERVLEIWEKHGRRLKRLGYSLEDLLTARPEPPGKGAAGGQGADRDAAA